MACLRTSGLRLLRATSISFGTPSSFGSWLSANTAFFFTSVSGSLSIAPVMVADRLLAGLLRQPEQRLAADLGAAVVARVAISVVSADGTVLTDRPKVDFLAHLVARILRDHPRQQPRARVAARVAEPERRVAAQPLGARRGDETFEGAVGGGRVVQRDRAHRGLADAVVAIAGIAATRSRAMPATRCCRPA